MFVEGVAGGSPRPLRGGHVAPHHRLPALVPLPAAAHALRDPRVPLQHQRGRCNLHGAAAGRVVPRPGRTRAAGYGAQSVLAPDANNPLDNMKAALYRDYVNDGDGAYMAEAQRHTASHASDPVETLAAKD